jgi:hypothetical protein
VSDFQEKDFLIAFKLRLRRVASTVWKNWKNIIAAFKDGALSGFISNIITTIINIFFTTAKNIVRIIREGTFVLFNAAKMILFPPKDMTLEEIWDAALKIIVTGTGTLAGICIEESLSKLIITIPLLAPLAQTLSLIVSGILTGLITSIALFAINNWDPFGACDIKKQRYIRHRLDEIGDEHISNLDEMCKKFGIMV